MTIARIALDVPLDEPFDFRIPAGMEAPIGALVVVPFGRARKVGVVVGHAKRSEVPASRLRDIESRVEDVAPLAAAELDLYGFCARYYQRPLGEVIAAALPPRLRQVRRRAVMPAKARATARDPTPEPTLTPEQEEALALIESVGDRFHPVLLQGITGSGKTEVYLRAIAATLARGRQALFLVPEIGLTPQLEDLVRGRFPDARVASAHSHLSEGERAATWLAAQSGEADFVLGTRLAVLMPFARLGLIVVDEEHDPSYKQQEGLRYSARDVAVRRAHSLAIPIVLGSATPSLESFSNARDGRYALATLGARATGATLPRVRTVDTRADRPRDGLSGALVDALRRTLAAGEQSLVFVNRRGFAPVLYCGACAWHSACSRCSANLVVHMRAGELRCHHCGHRERVPPACPSCGATDLAPIGHGTQRIEESLQAALPGARIARIDRDSTARKGALRGVLDQVRAGEIDILVGTQMLAKGHDYPNLTRVGVLDSDSALFSADFRAAERLFSQLVQVAGRAGRGDLAGEVLIQTDFPGHALYAAVATQDYASFANEALDERRAALFPPYSHLVLLRAESKKPGEATEFLRGAGRVARRLARDVRGGEVEVFDPVPAMLERKAGFERAQLLVRSTSRAALHAFLPRWREALARRQERRVRWALDVDPQDV
ncbi:MAG TPA: primosomal protein N' [Usitatibacter sp.]|nr:primosomal protein N' [Usitatibacter sp.]